MTSLYSYVQIRIVFVCLWSFYIGHQKITEKTTTLISLHIECDRDGSVWCPVLEMTS